MSCFGSNPISFLPLLLFLFICSTSLSFAHGASQFHHLQNPELVEGREHNGLAEWKTSRFLVETSNNFTTLILAANRTHRRDPSNGFNYYTGGWNVTDHHYLYSVGYSAAPLFIVGLVWFVVFGVCLCCMCLRRCCCCRRKNSYGYSRTAYALSLICLILFTVAAIAGSFFLYTGQGKFETSMVNVLSYVLKQADKVVENLNNVVNTLAGAKKIGVGQVSLPADLQKNIDQMQSQINVLASNLHNVTGKNTEDIRKFLEPM